METGYFFSKSTGLFVAKGPLRIDARVSKAASECDLTLQWDDEGRICRITFLEAQYLLQRLGATMMSMKEYWLVRRDAEEAGDAEMLRELQSERYAEWLNSVFENKDRAIDCIRVEKTLSGFRYHGTTRELTMPYGHPGWFNIEDVDYTRGLPAKVELNREKHATSWKYWSFCDYPYVAAAIRGWVTSVGKPSLDLGIPIDAAQPLLMVRECRRELPQPPIDIRIIEKAEHYLAWYREIVRQEQFEELYGNREEFLQFIQDFGHLFRDAQETRIYRIRERMIEILGLLRVIGRSRNEKSALDRIEDAASTAWGVQRSRQLTFNEFTEFVTSSRDRLEKSLASYTPIIFVIGHRNPDTDSVVSALAEAYRNHLLDGNTQTYVPLVQGSRMPDEVRRLLGDTLADAMLFSEDPLYRKAAESGQTRWILVDHNRNPDVQKFAISIVDHHIPSEVSLHQDIPKTIEIIGSTTALTTQRLHGLGLELPKELARILYAGTLMDTENRSPLKMTVRDRYLMDDLQNVSQEWSDEALYRDLMGFLLNTDDADALFERDYKEDWRFFGFAVAKAKNIFDRDGIVLKKALLDRLVACAEKNNREKNLPLTLIKVVDYEENNATVRRERVYLIFNKDVFPQFRETMFDLFDAIIRSTFRGRAHAQRTDRYIEFWGVGDQLSRKRIVPLLEPVAVAFNRYFYSPSTKLYVKRDFLKNTARVNDAARHAGISLSSDTATRINLITYGEAMRLLTRLGFTALSLKEYWQVLADAEHIKDRQMIEHLQSSGFVEFLHTIVEREKYLVDKPTISEGNSTFQYEDVAVRVGYTYHGTRRRANIPAGTPGLIHPRDIDPNTGLPSKVYPPNIYDNPALWRYWSPDAEKNVATRGYIFLLGQPALDLKVHLSEAFYCLGIRPCAYRIELPTIAIAESNEGISLTLNVEGETLSVREKDFFQDAAVKYTE